jgi:hypothetical protein
VNGGHPQCEPCPLSLTWQEVRDHIGFSHVLHDPALGLTLTIRFRWAPAVEDLQSRSGMQELLNTLNHSRLDVSGCDEDSTGACQKACDAHAACLTRDEMQ